VQKVIQDHHQHHREIDRQDKRRAPHKRRIGTGQAGGDGRGLQREPFNCLGAAAQKSGFARDLAGIVARKVTILRQLQAGGAEKGRHACAGGPDFLPLPKDQFLA